MSSANSIENSRSDDVYPYLIYCIEIWGNTHDSYLSPLIKLQKKAVRIITFSHYLEHSAPLFKQLDILNFKALVIQRISLLMYKIHMENIPLPICNLFIINNLHHNYDTRQKHDLHTQIRKKEKYLESHFEENSNRCVICMF